MLIGFVREVLVFGKLSLVLVDRVFVQGDLVFEGSDFLFLFEEFLLQLWRGGGDGARGDKAQRK